MKKAISLVLLALASCASTDKVQAPSEPVAATAADREAALERVRKQFGGRMPSHEEYLAHVRARTAKQHAEREEKRKKALEERNARFWNTPLDVSSVTKRRTLQIMGGNVEGWVGSLPYDIIAEMLVNRFTAKEIDYLFENYCRVSWRDRTNISQEILLLRPLN